MPATALHSSDPDGNRRVAVALSGGVDSAVTLMLLKEQGISVSGVFMKNWEEDDHPGHCAAERDLDDARRVCEHLAVELHTVNCAHEYWEQVFAGFLEDTRRGFTPNPDVLCNREIKFGVFLEHAARLGAARIATGHYARIRRVGGELRLLKGCDEAKDQSYFLYALNQTQLERALFPLGAMSKPQVRRLARGAALAPHAKKDSTGICFVGERPFKAFLERYLPHQPGDIVSLAGTRLGRHDGLVFYTIGQRHGLHIGGYRGGTGEPWYVAAKEPERNTLVVAQGREHPALYASALDADQVHWISGRPPDLPLRCGARIRYRQPDQPCRVTARDAGKINVEFAQPQWAAAPGQSVVFYAGEECLGGARILRAETSEAVLPRT